MSSCGSGGRGVDTTASEIGLCGLPGFAPFEIGSLIEMTVDLSAETKKVPVHTRVFQHGALAGALDTSVGVDNYRTALFFGLSVKGGQNPPATVQCGPILVKKVYAPGWVGCFLVLGQVVALVRGQAAISSSNLVPRKKEEGFRIVTIGK